MIILKDAFSVILASIVIILCLIAGLFLAPALLFSLPGKYLKGTLGDKMMNLFFKLTDKVLP